MKTYKQKCSGCIISSSLSWACVCPQNNASPKMRTKQHAEYFVMSGFRQRETWWRTCCFRERDRKGLYYCSTFQCFVEGNVWPPGPVRIVDQQWTARSALVGQRLGECQMFMPMCRKFIPSDFEREVERLCGAASVKSRASLLPSLRGSGVLLASSVGQPNGSLQKCFLLQ